MIANKHITRIVAVVMVIAVCLCLCAMVFSDALASAAGGTGVKMEYEAELFDTGEILSVNIIMDDADWDDMFANATSEIYYKCDVEVNGKMFYSVGIRPKGNTSLTSIASDPDTDRFSLKLEFDHYVEGQTCFGLDKLILNNNYADATNMKEALIYDMYQYLGADASLYNYAKISVNGGYWGVYLALEAVEDSFLLRNYGAEDGALYKPDSIDMGDMGAGKDFGNGDMGDFDPSQFGGDRPQNSDHSQLQGMTPPSANGAVDADADTTSGHQSADSNAASGERPDIGGGFGGFSMGGNGANLNYIDDELDSYSTIWDSEVTDTSKKDHKRVVKALKNISEGTNLEEYMDIDNLLKYMAVHVFSVNTDSLSGMMAHNYYLYEYNGRLNLLPWDYNLALGGMGGGSDATSTVNDAIDNAFSGTEFFNTLMEDEEYHAQYYAYLQQLVDTYINGGGFDAFYSRTRSQIDSLVESDPTAFYSYDEYLTAVDTLYEVVQLRIESISGQIAGIIPSTESEQRGSDALIDASALDLSVMGSMNMGDGIRSFMDEDSTAAPTDRSISTAPTDSSAGTAFPSDADVPEGFNPSQFDGEMPEGVDPSQFGGDSQANGQSTGTDSEAASEDVSGDGKIQSGFEMSKMPGVSSSDSSSAKIQNLVTYGVCFVILLLALLFVILYKQRSRRR